MHRSAAAGRGPEGGRAAGRDGSGRVLLLAGFAFGVAFGLVLGAVAYFTSRNPAPGGILAGAVGWTGHPDIAEDVIWFFSGGFIGGLLGGYAALRRDRSRADGVGSEHVLNRTFRALERNRDAGPGKGSSGRDAAKHRQQS